MEAETTGMYGSESRLHKHNLYLYIPFECSIEHLITQRPQPATCLSPHQLLADAAHAVYGNIAARRPALSLCCPPTAKLLRDDGKARP